MTTKHTIAGWASALMAALILTGCSTPFIGGYRSVPLENMKTAYVVTSSDCDPQIGAAICDGLAKHDVTARSGPMSDKPKDVAFYVQYEDHWRWDMAMYLMSLQIKFFDNTTGQPIANGSFQQGKMHDFSERRQRTFQVIDSIYAAK